MSTPGGSTAVELFSGAGGISCGLRMAGIESLGFEFCDAAVATARANGHHVIHADVRDIEPYRRGTLGLLAAGPPCQGFSSAGKGVGRSDLPELAYVMCEMIDAGGSRPPETFTQRFNDPRSMLILEPVHWILASRPHTILLEQVPAVLPLWVLLATLLPRFGYSTWAGVLRTEQYGLGQTRKRAVMLASLESRIQPPPAIHSRYYEHDPSRLDPDQPRWRSMADVLGWGMNGRPAPTITGGGTTSEPFARSARDALMSARGSDQWTLGDRRMVPRPIRRSDEPAPTLSASLDNGNTRWLISNYRTGGESGRPGMPYSWAPAATITSKADRNKWCDGIPLSIHEAALLQSFPSDYIFLGTKSQQFQQVGNAMPPLLAYACVKALLEST